MKMNVFAGAIALLISAPCFAATCATYDESAQLKNIEDSLASCDASKGSFIVNLPAGVSYKLYQHNMDKGDSCGVSETKTAKGTKVTVTVDMEPDSDENCQLYMFDEKNPSNHADMSIAATIDS